MDNLEITKKAGSVVYSATNGNYTVVCRKVTNDDNVFVEVIDGRITRNGGEPLPGESITFNVEECNATPRIHWGNIDDSMIGIVKPIVQELVSALATGHTSE